MGKRIKAARERLTPRTTQKDIGEAFGITDKAVSSWERDETIPELDRIPALARLLKVPLDWLLEGAGPPPAHDDLHVRIDELSPHERAAVDAMVESFHNHRGRVA